MNRIIATVVIVATLSSAAVAEAHKSFNIPKHNYSQRMEDRLNDWRVERGGPPLFDNIATTLMTIALNQANFQENRWTTRIQGEPFLVWNKPFVGNRNSAMMKTIRCLGLPFTPRQALHKLLYQGGDAEYYRFVMRLGIWTNMSVRAVYIHTHKGWFKGRGRCTAYYIALYG